MSSFLLTLFLVIASLVGIYAVACPDLCLVSACKSGSAGTGCMGAHCGGCAYNCPCKNAEDCKTGQYCQDKVCVAYATEGAACTPLTYIGSCPLRCQSGLVCNGVADNGVCVQV